MNGNDEETGAPFVYLVQLDIPSEHEAEFNRVYDNEHVPQIAAVPGVRRITRYKLERSSFASMPTYLTIYEVDSPEVLKSQAWRDAADTGEWKPKVRPHTTNRMHSLFRPNAG